MEYEWFIGQKFVDPVLGDRFMIFFPYVDKLGNNRYAQLFYGELFDFAFESEPLIDDPPYLKLNFTFDEGSWPDINPNVFPIPLPFDPKYPSRLAAGQPYGSSKTYKTVLEALPPTVALRKAFELTKALTTPGHDFEGMLDAVKNGSDDDKKAAIDALRVWLADNLDGDLAAKLQEAIPPGIPRDGMVEDDRDDWEPLGWELRLLYGFLTVLALP